MYPTEYREPCSSRDVCQGGEIVEDFEHLFSSQAGNVTARWEIVALKLLKLIQLDIRDNSTMWMTAELNYPQLAASVDVDGEVMDEDYSPSPGRNCSYNTGFTAQLVAPRPAATMKSKRSGG
ncbi:hypothetical protein LSAT2_028688 [Lamellibrachia satsuma]|nr:hypothetical protein LSAT2_028688 [Lamellibrachia satsuma]